MRRLKGICNNGFESRQMKRLFPTSLALLLVMASLGHVLAAAFCPRGVGRECCFAKTHKHSSSSLHRDMTVHDMQMDGMSMDGMNMDDMAIYAAPTDHLAMNDIMMFIPFSPPAFTEQAAENTFDQPVESCAHCLGHSALANATVPVVSAQSGKEIGRSVLLPASGFHVRLAIALAQIGLPREHAPPASSGPRHILISVFQI